MNVKGQVFFPLLPNANKDKSVSTKGTCLKMKPTIHMAGQIDQKNLGPCEVKILITDYSILGTYSTSGFPMFFFII